MADTWYRGPLLWKRLKRFNMHPLQAQDKGDYKKCEGHKQGEYKQGFETIGTDKEV